MHHLQQQKGCKFQSNHWFIAYTFTWINRDREDIILQKNLYMSQYMYLNSDLIPWKK